MPVCAEFADDKWDEEFMSDLGPANKLVCSESNSDEDSDCDDANTLEDASPHLKSLDEAISCLGDICNFLEDKGYTREANSSHALMDDLARLHCKTDFNL